MLQNIGVFSPSNLGVVRWFTIILSKVTFTQFAGKGNRGMGLVMVDASSCIRGSFQIAGINNVKFFIFKPAAKQIGLFFAFFAKLSVGLPLDDMSYVLFGLAVAYVVEFHDGHYSMNGMGVQWFIAPMVIMWYNFAIT